MIAYDHNKEDWQQKNASRHQSATVHCRGHEQIVGQPDKNIFLGHLICSTCAFWGTARQTWALTNVIFNQWETTWNRVDCMFEAV